ncbi:MAG: hypothetical protein LUG98_16505 [Tannerellaceae bacterium]|nr:hypothetical protein [Tannerellaceae bacterium]
MKKGTIHIDYTNCANPVLHIVLENGELWLSEYELTELLQTYTRTIRAKIKTLIKEGFLYELEISRDEREEVSGQVFITTYYNLDVLIHLSYRINTTPACLLREWFKTKLSQKQAETRKEELILTGTGFWRKERRFILN